MVGVAQLVRAPGCGPGCRGFESPRSPHGNCRSGGPARAAAGPSGVVVSSLGADWEPILFVFSRNWSRSASRTRTDLLAMRVPVYIYGSDGCSESRARSASGCIARKTWRRCEPGGDNRRGASLADGCFPVPAGGGGGGGLAFGGGTDQMGFAQAPVVMANEAHSGLARCVRTREVGVRMIGAAHQAGVRRLAMEALPCQPRTRRARSGPSRRTREATWLSRTCAG
jgi:hypothetical protein